MFSIRRISLQTKISAVTTLSVTLIAFILGSIFLVDQSNRIREVEDRFLNDAVRSDATIAHIMMPYLVENDFVYMNDLASFLSKRSGRAYVVVVDNNNRVMACSTADREIGSTFETPAAYSTAKISDSVVLKYVLAGKKFIDISYPIKAGDLVLGQVRMGLDADWLQGETDTVRRTILISSGAALAVILLGILLASAVAKKISQPMLLLRKAAEKIGKGDYSQKVDVRSADEVGVLAGSFNKMLEDLRESRAQLVDKGSALREKEVLLKEIHHRVKNNMQVIASLLTLQAGYLQDREARALLEESRQRVETMSLIHEKLYRSHDLAGIDFKEYVDELVAGMFSLYAEKSGQIEPTVNISGVFLDINNSIPCALIINELVSNVLRHAFPDGRSGNMAILMGNDGDGKITLIVSDNGIGFPEGIDFRNTKSLGMQLVNSLVSQINGTIDLDRGEGTAFRIEFRI